jgi:kinetochore protein Spc25
MLTYYTENRLLFTFTLIDAAHPDREFKFVIDTTNEAYTVPQCDPHLPAMPWLVDVLNSDGDLWAFIKKGKLTGVQCS